ncbi:Metallothionein expression activator [Parahypoxylon ruwenzoriense]
MLSNPPQGGLQARNRQHRRQNSTPTGFEAMKIATNLPTMHQHHQQQRPRVSHRRGMSLDTRRQQYQQRQQQMQSSTTQLRQEFPTHVLREAQQQRIARPGPQQAYTNLANDENYLLSPHGTPRTQSFEDQGFGNLPGQQEIQMNFDLYNEAMNMNMKKNQENFSNNITTSQDFDQFPSSALSTPTFMSFHDSPTGGAGWISEGDTTSTRRSSRRISNGIMDRVAKFENMGTEMPQRPLTPRQNDTDYFPLTPRDTPHDRTIKHSRQPQSFSEGYDESAIETIKPTRQSSNRRPQTTFDEMRQAAEAQVPMPMPSRANTMPVLETFNPPSDPMSDFLNMSSAGNGGLRIDTTFDGLPASSHPLSSTSDLSAHASPITPHMGEFNASWNFKPDLRLADAGSDVFPREESALGDKSSHRGTPQHRRNESIASITSAASIASIDIEKTKTATGITLEDIHQYIQGPDPRDNKWTCTFEDCNKKFGRKENIKSHVQTHLNDRQYKCPTCQKCFVRQHDLKRHAKIHTGIKPYPCECGNSFARHDALTRHKQRGMCIGAFDGVVRKVVKRGRPRKHRPDMDERKEKSTRTRKKNMSISSISSLSGCSDSSAVNSPENTEPDFGALDDIMDVSMGGTTMNPSSLQGLGSSSAPMPSLTTDTPTSTHSPSATSVHSYVSQLSHMSLHGELVVGAMSSQPASPARSVASHFNELPELSRSSSPPSCNRYSDAEPNSSGMEAAISTASETSSIPSFAGLGENDDDILLQFNNDPSMFMLSSDNKFDEAFDSVDMFTNSDDLFFGNC